MNRAAFMRAFALAALPPIGVAEASTVLPAAVTARLGGQHNVLDFPTFQHAHDALPALGGTIHVPAGRYSSTTVPAFKGLVITKPVAIVGVANGYGCALSMLMHDGDKDKDAIFLNLPGACLLQNLFIMRPDGQTAPGAGRGVRWYMKGAPARMVGLTIDNVTVWRSPNWAFEFVCDGHSDNYVGKLVMLECTAFDASSGGSLRLGGAGSNNNFFSRCEFNGPGFGSYINVFDCRPRQGSTAVGTSAGKSVAVGDEVSGMGIAFGTTITAVTASQITLSSPAIETPGGSGTTQLSFWRKDRPAGGAALPRGHVHLERTSISRFHHCSFQGPATEPALSTDFVSNDLTLRDCYREKASPTGPAHSFMINGVNNFLVDGFYQQFHNSPSRLLRTGPGGMNMGRITNAQLMTADTSGTDIVVLANAGDELAIDNSMEQNSGTGERRTLTVAGPGAVILSAVRGKDSETSTLLLPNGNDEVFFIRQPGPITKIAGVRPKRRVTLAFAVSAKLVKGPNLVLSSDFAGAPNNTITLVCDGTRWLEIGRSDNS